MDGITTSKDETMPENNNNNNNNNNRNNKRQMGTIEDSSGDKNDNQGKKVVNQGGGRGPTLSSSSSPPSSPLPSALPHLSHEMAKISLQEKSHEGEEDTNNQITTDGDDGNVDDNDETLKQKATTTTTILCDAGYGLPREKRPRQEKINAICGQLSNFISWQLLESSSSSSSLSSSQHQQQKQQQRQQQQNLCSIRIVGCCDVAMKSSIEQRLLENLGLDTLPGHVTISCDDLSSIVTLTTTKSVVVPPGTTSHTSSLNENKSTVNNNVNGDEDGDRGECCCDDVVYLSPDADEALDPTQIPPSTVVVGLIIDRRIQPDRSLRRASSVNIHNVKRWPFDSCFVNIDKNEPLNVDCIMEGMQQWWWNIDRFLHQKQQRRQRAEELEEERGGLKHEYREAFIQATAQALDHHADRHPSRSLHK